MTNTGLLFRALRVLQLQSSGTCAAIVGQASERGVLGSVGSQERIGARLRRVWDMESLERVRVLEGHSEAVLELAHSARLAYQPLQGVGHGEPGVRARAGGPQRGGA